MTDTDSPAAAPGVFPFTGIIGQEELKRCLVLCAIDPLIGGVLAFGDRGTGKTTTVRALGSLLELAGIDAPVVDMPLGVTEDRVIGSLDIDAALTEGQARFRPGLLSAANGGFLYIDEINLLDDHLVDVLLDVAASGVNIVERDGVSTSHPARFVLVGSGNPEEGDLRPQLQDRFGFATHVATDPDPTTRLSIVRARLAFDRDPAGFIQDAADTQQTLADSVAAARRILPEVTTGDEVLEQVIGWCAAAGTIGHRAELVVARAAAAHAALEGRNRVSVGDALAVAKPALRHRIHTEAFETPADIDARLGEVLRAGAAA
ncbi:ATP-binding protein [Corynebacterium mendelii]|uniref:ATP-binding protein n=1 Tax=Corynebacterium mendelii TaxID=2765362 RepID=A0A939E0A9_9CORY|nr:AAA family ATPase [Corynebacterium mendelii]MBN9644100.1 ATP-binding protein [Corynebacterium mendelii]